MRRIVRTPLPAPTLKSLSTKQNKANAKQLAQTLNVTNEWKSARQSKPVKTALGVLRAMAGSRERCMYCGDSHGTDIEHFWPKTPYPERMYSWANFLLGCTECGRFKGERFPLANNIPLMVDPTAEDPWLHLDFDPDTGNVVARFDPAINDWAPKGVATVELLQLDRREALAAGHRKTYLRLQTAIEQQLTVAAPQAATMIEALREADDHGLVGWCFNGTGKDLPPFSNFRNRHPAVWDQCAQELA